MARILSNDVIDSIAELRSAQAAAGNDIAYETARAQTLKANYVAATNAATTLDDLKAVVLDLIDEVL